ncbi:hypothetical protein SDC9_135505 [bioreactor metagenome]|uniref:Uncharacterized protein n=1 Tax=bioreactor metagenome TaxID=1076179 RepID=A0A645DIH6_9ZZZZ
MLNLPTIAHYGNKSHENALETLEAIKLFCEQLVKTGDDRLLSYTISCQYNDTMVNISVAGHVAEVNEWLKSALSIPPKELEEVSKWSEKTLNYLDMYKLKDSRPNLGDLLNFSGCLCFERLFLDPYYYDYNLVGSNVEILYKIPVNEKDLFKLVESGEISSSPAWIIKSSKCSRCGESYVNCTCSKYFQSGIMQTVEKGDYLGNFWTNRKA